MNSSTAPESNSFVAGSKGFEKSCAGVENIENTENKKGFWGSCLVSPIKNAVRYIAAGIRVVFRNIRSFLITVCSPSGSCFRKEKSAAPGQESPASVERGAGRVQRDASSRPAETHEQSALAKPVSQGADDLITLSGHVKLVSSDQGIAGFINRCAIDKPYGVVNSIDASGELRSGVGRAIRKLAGDDYARATRERQRSKNPSDRLGYGQCSTDDFVLKDWTRPEGAGGTAWQTIHNVLVPFANEPNFERHLKSSLMTLFNEAVNRELEHIVLPMLGCGRAGGTGGQLAQVLFSVTREFKAQHSHVKMPEIILVGTSSHSDKQVRADFESEWAALTRSAARKAPGSRARQSGVSTPSGISSRAVARPAPSSSRETPAAPPSVGTPERASTAGAEAMIRKGTGRDLQVDAASSRVKPHNQSAFEHPVNLRYPAQAAGDVITLSDNARIVISNHGIEDFIKKKIARKPYGVVNSIDGSGQLLQGVGRVIGNLAGSDYARATRERQKARKLSDRLNYGQCAVYDFQRDRLSKPSGSDDKWRIVCNVLIPRSDNPDFKKHLKNSFLLILEEFRLNDMDCIVFPMLGCGHAGGRSDQLAEAIFDARCEFASRYPHCQLPEMVLTSTGSDADRWSCAAFADKWNELHNQRKVSGRPVTKPDPASRTRQPDVSTPSDISSGAAARPVHLPSRETPADPSSDDVIPESAFPAKTGETDREDTGRGLQIKAALTRAEPHQPPPARPVSQNAHESSGASLVQHTLTSKMAAPVTLVYNADLESFIKDRLVWAQGGGGYEYGVVSPVDESGELQDGAARVVKDLAGDKYARKIRERQNDPDRGPIKYGHSGVYTLPSQSAPRQSSRVNRLHSVYCVRLPSSADQESFDNDLKAAIYGVLVSATNQKTGRIIFPFLGCDEKTGGTGGQLAKALHGALCDVRARFPDKILPKVFLLGADMDALTDGCQLATEFQDQWHACVRACKERQNVCESKSSNPSGTRPRVVADVARTATRASAETVTEAAINASAETVTEAAINASAETVTEAAINASAETVTEAVINASAETVTEAAINASAETVTEAATNASAETVTEAAINASAETVTEAAIRASAETVTEAATRASAETVTEAAINASAETVTEAAINASAETVTEASAGASARVVTRADLGDDQGYQHKVLIDGLLEVVMHADRGMFGYGRELSSKGEQFDLVNAANEHMCHFGGVAKQFAEDLGARFSDGTKSQMNLLPDGMVPPGQCITTESYDYASNSKFGLTGCRYIHSVVAPDKNRIPSAEYEDRFRDAFVSVLLAAAERSSDTVVSCFIGCAIFNGDGGSMARALHAAYHDDRIKSLGKVPKLVLTGWDNPNLSDGKVYRDFVLFFEMLNEKNPVKLPSRG